MYIFSLLGDRTTENTPILYGPLITEGLYNGECFKTKEDKSFRMETLEPWLAFTFKMPLIGEKGNVEGRFHLNTPYGKLSIFERCFTF